MRLIKFVQSKVTNFVKKRGSVLPKLFVWVYAAAFLACGCITVFGIIYEFLLKNIINYKAINDFVSAYFAPSIAGTFMLLGVLLIDKNNDGVPDKWENEENDDTDKPNDPGHTR